jgi:hypothetical protein
VDKWHFTFASRFPIVICHGFIDDLVFAYAAIDGGRDPHRNAQAPRRRRLKNE